MPYEVIRFPYGGAIDADGHVLEPAWLWEEYLEAAHRPRAIHIPVDPDGLEYLRRAPLHGPHPLRGGRPEAAHRPARPGEPREGGALPVPLALHPTVSGRGARLGTRPSELFRRQCFISGDPDETAAPHILDPVGGLSPATRAELLGENVRRLYGI